MIFSIFKIVCHSLFEEIRGDTVTLDIRGKILSLKHSALIIIHKGTNTPLANLKYITFPMYFILKGYLTFLLVVKKTHIKKQHLCNYTKEICFKR
jgi:hypothetical protein